MKLFGLIGYPLGHSWSARYFTEKFVRMGIRDAEYRNFPLEEIGGLLPLISKHPDLLGFNVTLPHKVTILGMLDEVDPVAAEIGAVNTVRISRNGNAFSLKGFNTDAAGFLKSLPDPPGHNRALILGNGGAARSVNWALQQIGVKTLSVSRNACPPHRIGYPDLNRRLMGEYTLIVNTTPLGMFPDTGDAPPIPWHEVGPGHLLYDLVYNPEETLFMKQGKARGAAVMNGMSMLVNQADAAWDLFFSDQDGCGGS